MFFQLKDSEYLPLLSHNICINIYSSQNRHHHCRGLIELWLILPHWKRHQERKEKRTEKTNFASSLYQDSLTKKPSMESISLPFPLLPSRSSFPPHFMHLNMTLILHRASNNFTRLEIYANDIKSFLTTLIAVINWWPPVKVNPNFCLYSGTCQMHIANMHIAVREH